MNHKFTPRELVLLCVAAFLALGIFYYKVVYENVQNTIKTYDVSLIENELYIYQAQASQEKMMKEAIEEASDHPLSGTIEVYDNLANEVAVLGSILNPSADSISISWAQPTLSDSIVRRQASISFNCSSYAVAKSVLEQLNNMQYRVIMNNVSINTLRDDQVSVSLTMTFFETTNGATSLDGLVVMGSDSETN